MKGNEVTAEDMHRWRKEEYIIASCRLCGEVELFPKEHYKPEQLQGYECPNCRKRRIL